MLAMGLIMVEIVQLKIYLNILQTVGKKWNTFCLLELVIGGQNVNKSFEKLLDQI